MMSLPELSQPHHLEAERLRLKVVRAMSAGKKLDIATCLYWSARDLKTAAFRSQHPEWSEEQLRVAVYENFLYARS